MNQGLESYPKNQLRDVVAIVFVIDGGGATLTTGVKGDLRIPFPCRISSMTLLADASGSIALDIYKDAFANFPPTSAKSIVGQAKPTLTSAQKVEDTTLVGWATTINAGETLRFNIDSVTTIKRVTVTLKATRL